MFLLGHRLGTMGTMVWVPLLGALALRTVESCTGDGCGMGTPPSNWVRSITGEKFLKICFQNPAFWCHERQKLASVGVQNGTVKREKLVLHNRMK